MTINLHLPSQLDTLKPKITVVGVGGAGGNAVNNMIAANLEGVDFVIANTDAQALEGAQTDRIIQLGATVTRGLGAGAKPEVGMAAAEEAIDEISDYIHGSNMVFITAGMGGGTGTGAAPVIARLAKEQGMLTVGVVTKPFQFEGAHRMRMAEAGIRELQQYVDTLIVVPNQNLFRIANEKTSFAEAFRLADEVLHSGVRGVTDLIVKPGLINLDFADIRTVMAEMGKAMMGAGEASGENRALMAAEAAISNPLLDDVSLKGARAVLINITAGSDFALYEVDEAINRIRDEVDPNANIIFGSAFSDAMEGKIRVSVVATGIDLGENMQRPVPEQPVSHAPRKQFTSPIAPATAAPRKERSAAEIVRQAGTATLTEAIRNAAPVAHAPVAAPAPRAAAPVQQPVIRIIDEPAVASHTQHYAPAVEEVDEPARAQTVMSEAGPLFVAPRAEVPQQRTLFSATAPEMEEEEEETGDSRSIFGRLANVGKSFTGSAKAAAAAPVRAAAAVHAQATATAPERKAEVRETTPHAGDEEEFYDIPAFLRRQAN